MRAPLAPHYLRVLTIGITKALPTCRDHQAPGMHTQQVATKVPGQPPRSPLRQRRSGKVLRSSWHRTLSPRGEAWMTRQWSWSQGRRRLETAQSLVAAPTASRPRLLAIMPRRWQCSSLYSWCCSVSPRLCWGGPCTWVPGSRPWRAGGGRPAMCCEGASRPCGAAPRPRWSASSRPRAATTAPSPSPSAPAGPCAWRPASRARSWAAPSRRPCHSGLACTTRPRSPARRARARRSRPSPPPRRASASQSPCSTRRTHASRSAAATSASSTCTRAASPSGGRLRPPQSTGRTLRCSMAWCRLATRGRPAGCCIRMALPLNFRNTHFLSVPTSPWWASCFATPAASFRCSPGRMMALRLQVKRLLCRSRGGPPGSVAEATWPPPKVCPRCQELRRRGLKQRCWSVMTQASWTAPQCPTARHRDMEQLVACGVPSARQPEQRQRPCKLRGWQPAGVWLAKPKPRSVPLRTRCRPCMSKA
mmetsp:Transcript_14206/g.43894  ORF Transcript_14206/g.43894 Transcript_14206/m.43894 type:complete len:477 (-) Transcript_14206:104-1534(-)